MSAAYVFKNTATYRLDVGDVPLWNAVGGLALCHFPEFESLSLSLAEFITGAVRDHFLKPLAKWVGKLVKHVSHGFRFESKVK